MGMEETVEQQETSENINLGPSIELVGFKELDRGAMPVIKKIVGHGVKTLSEKSKNFQRIKITMKSIHKGEGHGQYELHAMADIGGKSVTSELTERNLYFGLSNLLNKIEHQI